MTSELISILICIPIYVPLFIVNSFCDKHISSKGGNQYKLLYNCLKFLFGALILLPFFLLDTSPKFAAGTVLCGIGCGVMYAISKTIILKGYEKTSIVFMTFCHSAGMIVPCIIGNFLWNEKLSVISIAGILLTIFSILLLTDSKGEKSSFGVQGILIGAVVFLASGGVMVAQKLMGIYFYEQSISAYNFYSFVVAFAILSCFSRPKSACEAGSRKPMVLCAFASAASLCIISMLMTKLAVNIPSIILFPLFNGLGILFVSIGSTVVFKEKLTKKKIAGIVLGICGLCITNF